MIIPEYKALFIHIPKSAGQTIQNQLLFELKKTGSGRREDYLLKENNDPNKGPKRLAHLTAREYTRYNYVSNEEFNSYYKFSFVRNPWSRVLSFYKSQGYSSLISINDFVLHFLPQCIETDYWFFRPQTEFIYDEDDNLLVDFVGKLENINNDFRVISEKLNLDFTKLSRNNYSIEKGLFSRKSINLLKEKPSLLKYLTTKSRHLEDDKHIFNEASLDLINKFYQRDIDLLDY